MSSSPPHLPARAERYFVRMNAASDDKARLLPWVRPGLVIEIGPGGGVLLDLLADALPGSDVLGLDASEDVVAALARRRATEGRRWRCARGDVFALSEYLPAAGADSVIFCSVLHEIFSYVVHPPDDGVGPPRRFQRGAVRAACQAAFAALRPGGRLVVRDGVAPPPGRRRLRLRAPDAAPMLERFVAEFPARPIVVQPLADGRVELAAADAMEFLYTYTWGEASFSHEVQEQYGVLTVDDYAASLQAWLGGPAAATLLPLPNALRSYLQPGYAAHLADKVELTDEHDRPVALPDSNCVLVVEKR